MYRAWVLSLILGVVAMGMDMGVGVAQAADSTAIAAEAAGTSVPSASSTVGPLPTEAYARGPEFSQLIVSPNGRRIAWLANEGDDTSLLSRELDGSDVKFVLKSDNKQFSIRWVHWVGNEHLVASVRFPSRRGHVPVIETRLLAVPWEGGKLVNLMRGSPFDARRVQAQLQDGVIDWLPSDGRRILIQMASDSVLPAVYEVDVTTAERRTVQAPRRGVHHWVTDASHRVRAAVRFDDAYREVQVCDPDGQNWRTLWRFKVLSKEAVWPMGFGKDPNQLYIQADHEGRTAVFAVDLSSPDLRRTLRLSHPRFDVGGELINSPVTGEAIGVRAQQDNGERTILWDAKLGLLAKAIDIALPDRINRVLGFSADERRYVVYSSGNGIPGTYYLGDQDSGDLLLLAETYPQLPRERMVGKRPVRIKARDGLPLVAYLTIPRGKRPAGGLPMVLLPHGGPQYRDSVDFDTWTEFLAARGYAVLQIDFRGSAGYGHDFMAAGLQRWGLDMQDDLTDAVRWAVASRIADPSRVCIVGASYGGYAALIGAVKTPELYRCVVSFAGVSDLIDLWNFKADFIGGAETMDTVMGNAWRDRERLRATSPVRQAERVQAPVLLVHGTADRIVPVEQSEDMANALRKEGKAYQFIKLEEGDHNLSRPSHRLAFFTALESFLARHIGAGAEARPQATAPSASTAAVP